MSPCKFTEATFLNPTTIHCTRSFLMFETQRRAAKAFFRKAQGPPYYPKKKCARLGVMNMDTNNTNEFEKLTSDIKEYLKTCSESESSPLAYITLRKTGRLDLISRIMDAGGYIKVSRQLGVPVDESQFIPPPPTFASSNELSPDTADDNNASLAIGRDLEERLNTIEEVMKNNGDRVDSDRKIMNVPSVTDDVPTGEELQRQSDTSQPTIIDEPIPVGERFILTLGMRIGILSLAVVSAIGLGRSSHGVISDDVISICRSLTFGVLFAHFVLGVYAGVILAPQKHRNTSLWFAKVLLGGPIAIQYLQGLDVLPD